MESAMGIPLLTFIVPLVSKATCANWDEVMACFKATIASIYNQTCPDYRVLVVCNEPPNVHLNPENTTVLSLDLKLKNKSLGALDLDKERKMYAGLFHVRSTRSEYVMFLDADDLVSCQLVQYVSNNREYDGFVVDRGYVWEKGSKWMFSANRFYLRCGSCYVFRYREGDTPDTPQLEWKYWWLTAHNKRVKEEFARHAYRYVEFPFPAVIYVQGHRDSIRARYRTQTRAAALKRRVSQAKDVLKRAFYGKTVDDDIRREFGGLA